MYYKLSNMCYKLCNKCYKVCNKKCLKANENYQAGNKKYLGVRKNLLRDIMNAFGCARSDSPLYSSVHSPRRREMRMAQKLGPHIVQNSPFS